MESEKKLPMGRDGANASPLFLLLDMLVLAEGLSELRWLVLEKRGMPRLVLRDGVVDGP